MHLHTTKNLLPSLLLSAIGGSALTAAASNDSAYLDPITTEQILKIAPQSASCDNPPAAGECATADIAARSITSSFERYQVSSPAEQAAVIGLMAFESGEFKYNRNHFPGVPGQGTRNMQSPAFNLKYAQSIPEIRDEVSQANGDVVQILDLLLSNEEYDFGSGAWFLRMQCDEDVQAQLRSGTEEGWEAYITKCVGTDANAARRAYWQKAVEVL
ncbi:uncharacterized protein DNG_09428 [Cephalotrichum gorgonifer]|uniref:Transglycosylase SLT domain-containing protein n=1 Tax=Cephalotrichum gorgonifer TaxID=2041049 RepID=A0AAE8SZC9_9PEZI|nr:uncharacterized protein DNG_09428 [Cephalotrichum gorgonifer]